MKYVSLFLTLIILSCNDHADVALKVIVENSAPTENLTASYNMADRGKGNTSVAHDDSNIFKWSGQSPYAHESWGYFDQDGKEIPYIKRDRDLGQTFLFEGSSPKHLKSVTVRTGFGSNAVRPGMYGQAVSIQFFEVTGNPVINNNESNENTEAFHGFPHNRMVDSIPSDRDDFIEGETYKPLMVIRGGLFPSPVDFGLTVNNVTPSPDDPNLKGKYLKFVIPSDLNILLHPQKQYAFLIMIDKAGPERGFTLANNYYGNYKSGHGIRRDGNGKFPPVQADPRFDFIHKTNLEALKSAHFPSNFEERCTISPGTNGYPDVCTWRDLEFYIEVK
jgi:hypothetical protein